MQPTSLGMVLLGAHSKAGQHREWSSRRRCKAKGSGGKDALLKLWQVTGGLSGIQESFSSTDGDEWSWYWARVGKLLLEARLWVIIIFQSCNKL